MRQFISIGCVLLFGFTMCIRAAEEYSTMKQNGIIRDKIFEIADKYMEKDFFLTESRQKDLEREIETTFNIPLEPKIKQSKIEEGCNARIEQRTKERVDQKFPKSVDELVQAKLDLRFPLWKQGETVTVHFCRNRLSVQSIVTGKLYRTRKGYVNIKSIEIPCDKIVEEDRIHADEVYNSEIKKRHSSAVRDSILNSIEVYYKAIRKEEYVKEFPHVFSRKSVKAGYLFVDGCWITRKQFCGICIEELRNKKEKAFWNTLGSKDGETISRLLEEICALDLIDSQKKRIQTNLAVLNMPLDVIVSEIRKDASFKEVLDFYFIFMMKNPKYTKIKELCSIIQKTVRTQIDSTLAQKDLISHAEEYFLLLETIQNFSKKLPILICYEGEKVVLCKECEQMSNALAVSLYEAVNKKINEYAHLRNSNDKALAL